MLPTTPKTPSAFGPTPEARGFYAAPSKFLVVHASNFRAVERVGDTVHGFATVPQKIRGRLVLVGSGPERAEALSIAHNVGVDDSVTSLSTANNPEEVTGVADVL